MNVNEMSDIGFCLVEMTSTRFIWKLRGEDYNFVTFAYFYFYSAIMSVVATVMFTAIEQTYLK